MESGTKIADGDTEEQVFGPAKFIAATSPLANATGIESPSRNRLLVILNPPSLACVCYTERLNLVPGSGASPD